MRNEPLGIQSTTDSISTTSLRGQPGQLGDLRLVIFKRYESFQTPVALEEQQTWY